MDAMNLCVMGIKDLFYTISYGKSSHLQNFGRVKELTVNRNKWLKMSIT